MCDDINFVPTRSRANSSSSSYKSLEENLRVESLKFVYNSDQKGKQSDNDENDLDGQVTWNEAFQRALEMPQTTEAQKLLRSEFIATVSQDFVQTAIMYGKIIISEVFLPDENKTIKPTKSIGGNAGGEKYLFNGILFKFAIDWKDIYSSDMYAMKAASHEMKGLEQFLELEKISMIRVPLMTIIDYLGFRLIALSVLPINNTTLVYGSNDSGYSVIAEDPYKEIMEEAGKQMNLQKHTAGQMLEKSCVIPFPADIEGHIGTDNRFYALDFARVMPPTYPTKSINMNQYLYNLFRPEFVKKYKVPLNPDSFSNFDKHDTNRLNYRIDIDEATKDLLETIPNRIGSMESSCEFSDKTNSSQFVNLIHRLGINVRYLALVRKTSSCYLRAITMVEMVSRVIKNHLRQVLRDSKREKKVMAMQPYRQAILNEFNTILGNTPEHKKKSVQLWNKLQHDLETQFVDFPSPEELKRALHKDIVGVSILNDICPSSRGLEEGVESYISYECFTCGLVYPQGICQVCSRHCHSNHSLSKPQFRTKTFCSCEKGCTRKTYKPTLLLKSGLDHELKSLVEALGFHRVFERVAYLAGITIAEDALTELKEDHRKFVFVLPDIIRLKLKSKQMTIATLSEARSLHLHGIMQTKAHERTRIFHQCNALFEKTIHLSPGSTLLRSQFLDSLYEQIITCQTIDEKILSKFVEYCQDQRDSDKAKNIVHWIYRQGELATEKARENIQACFSIILNNGRDMKVKERMEVLEFIAEHGSNLMSLDLNFNEYCVILNDEILIKLSDNCHNLHYLKLKYQPRKVSEETLINITSNWKQLRHVDLNNCPIHDDVISAFATNCPYIRSLDLSNCQNLTNDVMRAISKFSFLNVLNISYNENLSDIGHLSSCAKLELLTMKQCQLKRIQFTRMVALGSGLKFLDLGNCTVDNPNVLQDIFTFCPHLYHLYLDGWVDGKEIQLLDAPKSLSFLSINRWKVKQSTVSKLKRSLKLSYNERDIIPDMVHSISERSVPMSTRL